MIPGPEKLILGIGGLGVNLSRDGTIKTMALGSCVAVVFYAPAAGVSGMVHVALPDSALDPAKGRELPGYFADTGIDMLKEEFRKITFMRDLKGCVIKIAGGASVLCGDDKFDIGKRNISAVRRILWEKYGVYPKTADVGGRISRTVTVYNKDGKMEIYTPGRGLWTI
jgi:chemotaxis protein CheD